MKPTRFFATASLVISSFALITAASISVGDEPGVVRMTPRSASGTPTPQNGPAGAGVATLSSRSMPMPNGSPSGPPAPMMEQGLYPQPGQYAPYFERSYSATEVAPNISYQPVQPFGPIMMFESNIGDGLGYESGYQRFNARLPYHIVPDQTVLMLDANASVTFDGDPLVNMGLIYRNYDQLRNRIFGYNGYVDYDQGITGQDWYRAGAGLESLGEYLDFRMNGYFMVGDDSVLQSSQLTGGLVFAGNGIFRNRENVRENAYTGADFEVGGPLPILGRYGVNLYGGGYYLDNDHGKETWGGQARLQALITQNVTVNTTLTSDDNFGTNTWVSLQYEIPNYGRQRTLRPVNTRERLSDPVYRNNRVAARIDTEVVRELCINDATGVGYNIVYVDPNNATGTNAGTFENPYQSLSALANNGSIDIIRVSANEDGTGTGLTRAGGLSLFDNQALISGNSDYEVFRIGTDPFVIPATGTTTLRPIISNPNMLAGQSVVQLANNNTLSGLQINASNAAGTVFGNGVANPLPIVDVKLQNNLFTNYVTGADLQDISGRAIITDNTFTGQNGTTPSTFGMNLTVAGGQPLDLLLTGNTATLNQTAGLSVTANAGSTLNADDLDGNTAFVPPTTGKYLFDDEATGIANNITTENGNGIVVAGKTGSTINAVIENNTSTDNTLNGLFAQTDGGIFNLSSLRGNTMLRNSENGVFIHYLNGGTFNAASEDANGNGILDAGEDLNGNGTLDEGIVSNDLSNNTIAGLCIFGEDASTGIFDIGGPTSALGNSFIGNAYAGVAVDLRDTATAQMDAVNNLISSSPTQNTDPTLTFVLDFVEAGQTIVDPFGSGTFTPFDVTSFGFAASDFDTVTNSVLNAVRAAYYEIPTVGADARSPIPDGQQLDVNFVIGDIGVAPTIGATEFYTTVIGDAPSPVALGVAWGSSVRTATGAGPAAGFTNGSHVASVYSNAIQSIGGLTPADLFTPAVEPPGIHYDLPGFADSPVLQDALTSGNLTFTTNALAGTVAHEIGHTLSLSHMNVAGSVTPSGVAPIMGTGAIDLPNQARITRREFGYSGQDAEQGGATVQHVAQLLSALGTRDAAVAGTSGDGIRIDAQDSARLQPSTFLNNTITNNSGDGIAIRMNDNAVAEGVTIQTNTITGNSGRGIDLVADGAGARIIADGTIGGTGINTLGGSTFSQGNTISNNQSDGIRALAANEAEIYGNAINNLIDQNGGNGIALQIDNGGVVDFGTTASNRVIQGNAITGNGGAGILLVSNVSATTEADMIATVLGNTITSNVSGGIVAELNGPNHTPPALPAVVDNNRLALSIGGTADEDVNTIAGNGSVGIGVEVTGNGQAVVDILNTTVSGTLAGSDPRWNGDGIGLRRADSSYLEATITNSTSTGNNGDGLDVFAQGNDKLDPNQPMSGTANTVTVLNSAFSNNNENGANYRLFGDATLISDITGSSFNSNGLNGATVTTRQNSSFGDPTDGLPPGRRSIWNGNTFNNNSANGVNLNASDDSRVLVEITSDRVAGSSAAHAGANTNGNSTISNNGLNGVRIDTTGGQSDILITAGTGSTTIDGNGSNGGGNGILWNASGDSNGTVRVTRTTITNSVAGASEDLNGNGILDAGEDLNNNDDIDVADGDGIQANFSENSIGTLVIGNIGEGNRIQNNTDDGIAITATGSDATGNPRPVISIVSNTIGGTINGLDAGNGGDGVSLNVFGGTAVGTAPAAVDFTLPILSDNSGVLESGAVPQFTMTNNLVSNNNGRGVNLLLTGASGTRDREGGASLFDPVLITLNSNTIVSNGAEGIFYRADSDMNQSRFVYLQNFPDPPITGNQNLNYSPFRPEFFALNAGSVNGNTAYLAPYMNLRTVQNSFLTVTNNVIQNNGVNTVTGEGLRIDVGTGAYVAADIQGNVFGGNLEEDFVTSSFLSAGNTFDSVDTTGDLTFDYVYLDDTAQLDVRFQNNSGNQIAPSDVGAVYTNADPLKTQFFGPVGVLNRDVSLFQVDNGPNLNNPNNSFLNFGITQDIQNAFTIGNYGLRGAADPAFPNIGFAPILP